jgi:hypothetical protein
VIFAGISAASRLSPSATAARSSNTLHALSAEGARCGKLSGPTGVTGGPWERVWGGTTVAMPPQSQASATSRRAAGGRNEQLHWSPWREAIRPPDAAVTSSSRVNPRRRSMSLDRPAVRAIASSSPPARTGQPHLGTSCRASSDNSGHLCRLHYEIPAEATFHGTLRRSSILSTVGADERRLRGLSGDAAATPKRMRSAPDHRSRLPCHDWAQLWRGRTGRQGRAFGPRFARP